jgi:xanthine dehydrogenase accessory factor
MTTEWGTPESAVLSRAQTLRSDGRDAAIATLVDVDGSAYRRPGAKVVVSDDGEGTGAITSGCLETEIARIIDSVIDDGTPRLETFDLRLDDDSVGLEIGCDGRVEILIEPLDESYANALSARATRERGSLLTVVAGTNDGMVGNRGWYPDEGRFEAVRGEWPRWIREGVTETARRLAESGGAETIRVGGPHGSARVFIDGIVPPPRLLVIGSGNDVGPLVRVGSQAGFDVTVVGYRGGRVDEERFPDATAVRSTSPRDLRDVVDIGEDTYCVVMTHDVIDDRLTIEALLQTQSPYIGVVSSKGRTADLIEAIERDGSALSATDQRRIYAPIGLDLGGGAPSQIALSIVSEALTVHNEREPGHLRDRTEPIHDRPK